MRRRTRPPKHNKHNKMKRLEDDPRFLARIERARRSLREGKGTRLEDVKE